MRFCPLFSGSSGNALYVSAGDTHILIDAGLSGRTVLGALTGIGVDPSCLSAILVTHEHSDHTKGVGILARKLGIPVYANEPTWDAMEGKLGKVNSAQRRIFETGQDFFLGDFAVAPFAIPHDAAQPVGFCLTHQGRKIAVATDLGHMTKTILNQIEDADLLLLEANHDVETLKVNPNYSYDLKRRILGNQGHLSNEACATALVELAKRGLKTALLGHLSGENNTPELAQLTVSQILVENGIDLTCDLHLEMTHRDHAGGIYALL